MIKKETHRRCVYHNIRWAFAAVDSFGSTTIVGFPIILFKKCFIYFAQENYVVIDTAKIQQYFQPAKKSAFFFAEKIWFMKK
jgi:hypothetical protein